MSADVKAVLVTFCLVLVLEPVAAEGTFVLLLCFVGRQLFRGFKLLWLLGTAVAHEETRNLGAARLVYVVQLAGRGKRPALLIVRWCGAREREPRGEGFKDVVAL